LGVFAFWLFVFVLVVGVLVDVGVFSGFGCDFEWHVCVFLFFCSDNFYHYWCVVFFVFFCAFVVSWYFFLGLLVICSDKNSGI
jgi:hypothetical protein